MFLIKYNLYKVKNFNTLIQVTTYKYVFMITNDHIGIPPYIYKYNNLLVYGIT